MSTPAPTPNPSSPFKIFGRDPVLWLEVVKYALAFVGVFLIPGLSDDVQIAVLAVVTAVFSVAQAVAAWPPQPTVFSGLVTALAGLLVYTNTPLEPDTVFMIQGGLAAIMTLLVRGNVTPVVDPVVVMPLGGAGATVDTADPPPPADYR